MESEEQWYMKKYINLEPKTQGFHITSKKIFISSINMTQSDSRDT
jgi:hypothetical protein